MLKVIVHVVMSKCLMAPFVRPVLKEQIHFDCVYNVSIFIGKNIQNSLCSRHMVLNGLYFVS